MTKKELPKLIPFSIAFIFVLIYLVEILLNPGYINEQGYQVTYLIHNSILYAGFGLLLVFLLIILKKPAWKYLCAIVMILALTPLLSFYNSELFLGIFGVEIELKTLGLLILHFVLNPEILPAFNLSSGQSKVTPESAKAEFESAVEGFELRFRNKSVQELEGMITDKSLVPEAIEAAKRLLQKKNA